MSGTENGDILHGINLLPKKGRTLEGGKESYEEQLGLNLGELYASCLNLYSKYGEVRILDIGGYNSKAISQLKGNLINLMIPEDKIVLTKIDLEKIEEEGVNLINGDLENDDFLIELIRQIGVNNQGIIFMNQVSQYLGDRLKIIKFITEVLLTKGGKFYFNMVPTTFYSGNLPISMLVEEMEEIWENENDGIVVNKKSSSTLPHLLIYEIEKKSTSGTISMPGYRRIIETAVNGTKLTAYNIKERITTFSILSLLSETKKLINSGINPQKKGS